MYDGSAWEYANMGILGRNQFVIRIPMMSAAWSQRVPLELR
jgi:hypothetical protein